MMRTKIGRNLDENPRITIYPRIFYFGNVAKGKYIFVKMHKKVAMPLTFPYFYDIL